MVGLIDSFVDDCLFRRGGGGSSSSSSSRFIFLIVCNNPSFMFLQTYWTDQQTGYFILFIPGIVHMDDGKVHASFFVQYIRFLGI